METYKGIVDLASAALAPTIAIVGLLLALRQSKLNHLRMRFDLFERRVEIYDAIQNALMEAQLNDPVPQSCLNQAHKARRDSIFLFGDDAHQLIKETSDKIYKFASLQRRIVARHRQNTPQAEAQLERLYAESDAIQDWFTKAKEQLHSVMLPYMKFPHK